MTVAPTSIALEFLLVSNDHSTLKAVKAALDGLGSNLNCSTTADAARLYISRHRLDGLILDLDVESSVGLIASIRQGGANRRAFIFVCVEEGLGPAAALKGGANVLLIKPLDPEKIATNIKAFQGIMTSERRRYFRHQVTIPVSLTLGDTQYGAMIENLSEGGMAVLLQTTLEPSTNVEFSFELPFGPRVAGKAQVVWANRHGVIGLEFRLMRGDSEDHLVTWLTNRALKA
jgi:response regulator RpfG family c-di-GMP phosphodiesterase